MIALDMFLLVNDRLLLLSSQQVYELAKTTVQANAAGRNHDEHMRELSLWIEEASFPFHLENPSSAEDLQRTHPEVIRYLAESIPSAQYLIAQVGAAMARLGSKNG